MCDFDSTFAQFAWNGNYTDRELEYAHEHVSQGKCTHCGLPMRSEEIERPGYSTKGSMHDRCYQEKFLSGNSSCVVCGKPLSGQVLKAQRMNPREVSNHMCGQECIRRWALVHSAATGSLGEFMANRQRGQMRGLSEQVGILEQIGQGDDIIDAEYWPVGFSGELQGTGIGLGSSPMAALPDPADQHLLTFQDWMKDLEQEQAWLERLQSQHGFLGEQEVSRSAGHRQDDEAEVVFVRTKQ